MRNLIIITLMLAAILAASCDSQDKIKKHKYLCRNHGGVDYASGSWLRCMDGSWIFADNYVYIPEEEGGD